MGWLDQMMTTLSLSIHRRRTNDLTSPPPASSRPNNETPLTKAGSTMTVIIITVPGNMHGLAHSPHQFHESDGEWFANREGVEMVLDQWHEARTGLDPRGWDQCGDEDYVIAQLGTFTDSIRLTHLHPATDDAEWYAVHDLPFEVTIEEL